MAEVEQVAGEIVRRPLVVEAAAGVRRGGVVDPGVHVGDALALQNGVDLGKVAVALQHDGVDAALHHGADLLQLARRLVVGGRHQQAVAGQLERSEEHTSELQSLMRISYAVFCLKKKTPTCYVTSPPRRAN